jgi:hypothetical protein
MRDILRLWIMTRFLSRIKNQCCGPKVPAQEGADALMVPLNAVGLGERRSDKQQSVSGH